jgi:hypothetical protein
VLFTLGSSEQVEAIDLFQTRVADQQLEINKQNFFLDFVKRPAFLAPGAYPIADQVHSLAFISARRRSIVDANGE